MNLERPLRRLLDANQNRAVEALRVLEDCARFLLEQGPLAARCKEIRHALRMLFARPGLDGLESARDAASDVLRPGSPAPAAAPRAVLPDLVRANGSRAQEALRVLEEAARLFDLDLASGLERLRYAAYDLERDLLLALPRVTLGARLRAEPICLLLSPAPGRPPLLEMARQALAGGARFFQLRLKDGTDRQRLAAALDLAELCRDADALLAINDRADLAALCPGAGLHLGQTDLPPAAARSIIGPERFIGASIHDRAELTHTLSTDLDYLGVGTIYSSQTNPDLGTRGPGFIAELAPLCPIPIFAIGGISAANAAPVIRAGASGIAIAAAILDAPDITQATRDLIAAVTAAREENAP